MRNCPTIVARGTEAKKDPSEGTVTIPPSGCRFYHLQTKVNPDEGIGKL